MKKIVVSGSMAFFSEMEAAANALSAMGFAPIIPREDDWDKIPPKKINQYKGEVSKRYFGEIANEETFAVFVVNEPKNGVHNYIGANTFAEIAIAFFFDKKIFLLNDVYAPFSDELLGWGAVSLKGDLAKIKEA